MGGTPTLPNPASRIGHKFRLRRKCDPRFCTESEYPVKKKESLDQGESERRRDDVLRRMLKTKPKAHSRMKTGKVNQKNKDGERAKPAR